jgi:hypothetical protein
VFLNNFYFLHVALNLTPSILLITKCPLPSPYVEGMKKFLVRKYSRGEVENAT